MRRKSKSLNLSMQKHITKAKLWLENNKQRKVLIIFVLLFALVGSAWVVLSRAATYSVALEAESGVIVGPATVAGSDSTASNSASVLFNTGITPPPVAGSCLTNAGANIFKVNTANGFLDYPPSGSIYDNTNVPNSRVFDATNTTWHYSLLNPNGDGSQLYSIKLWKGSGVCWAGGRVISTLADSANADWQAWHDLNGFRIGGMNNFRFENLYVSSFGDLINISDNSGILSDNVTITDTLFRHSHDDCIQNDKMASLKLVNSFLDGCYSGISARFSSSDESAGVINGSNDLLEVENTLIWMKPISPVYKGTNPGHGGFFKWENIVVDRGMKLSLKGVTLMARQDANHQSLGNEAGALLATCQNVTIIWLGSGAYPGTGWPAGCVTVVTGQAGKDLWLQKVNAWYSAHPAFADLKPADTSYFQ